LLNKTVKKDTSGITEPLYLNLDDTTKNVFLKYIHLSGKRIKFAYMALIISALWIHLLSGVSRADMSGNLSASIANSENSLVQESETIFTVQIGVFSVQDTATMMIAELRKVSINCSVNNWKQLYKVSCGSLDLKKDANELRMKLVELGYKDAFLVKEKRDKLSTGSSIVQEKNVETKSLTKVPQDRSVSSSTGSISNENAQREKMSSIGTNAETDNDNFPLLQNVQEKDSDTEKTGEQNNVLLEGTIPVQGERALKDTTGEKMNLTFFITAIIFAAILMFFLIRIVIRRARSIQVIKVNRAVESYKDVFNRYAVPVIGGIIIGLISALIMKFMGKHLSF